jgi:hypothetical protein
MMPLVQLSIFNLSAVTVMNPAALVLLACKPIAVLVMTVSLIETRAPAAPSAVTISMPAVEKF